LYPGCIVTSELINVSEGLIGASIKEASCWFTKVLIVASETLD
jgi:hypothetical protein